MKNLRICVLGGAWVERRFSADISNRVPVLQICGNNLRVCVSHFDEFSTFFTFSLLSQKLLISISFKPITSINKSDNANRLILVWITDFPAQFHLNCVVFSLFSSICSWPSLYRRVTLQEYIQSQVLLEINLSYLVS